MNYLNSRLATMSLFFMFGMIYAAWGVHVPTLKEKFGLNEAMLSIALFAVALGSIGALTCISPWMTRVGNRIACMTGGLLTCSCAALILFVPWLALLLPLLVLFGVGVALIDVAMNTEATAVETKLGRPIMSSLHGMFNVGGMVSAASGGLLLSHGVSPPVHMVLAAATGCVLVLIAYPLLLAAPAKMMQPSLPRNRHTLNALWALGSIALIALIAEGAMYDWLTVYMRETLNASRSITSIAYALFLAGMASGRFVGDAVRLRIGNESLLFVSGLLACVAMIAGLLLAHYPIAALISFALVGLGLANMIPMLVLAATHINGVHATEGITYVAGMAYVGLLIGPVLIGALAQATTLPIGLSLIALCAALIGGIGPRVLRKYCHAW